MKKEDDEDDGDDQKLRYKVYREKWKSTNRQFFFVILILHQLCTVQLKVVSRSIEHVLGARVNKRLDFLCFG